MSEKLRLDKFLSELALGTRSQVKSLIAKGHITVNGTMVKRPESKISSTEDTVAFDGQILSYTQYEYYMLNKPAGYISATTDKQHKTVMELITDSNKTDMFPVGRLDIDTEGLLLITNDGALAHELLSPKKHVAKTYFARIDGPVTEKDCESFKKGIDIGEKNLTKPAELIVKESGQESLVLVTITEGKYHQIKRMFEKIGRRVLYLKRLRMGTLVLDEQLKPGEYRALTEQEKNLLIKGQDK